mgnify:CR=1 FL=1|tara:strand:- start:279 stop:1250 length:972 start_codon:yes stop_codon:yes gene_type:complete
MNKCIAIIAGEPNSISSEIIFKSWKLRKKFNHKPFFIIGNIKLLNLQMEALKYNIKIKKIDQNFKLDDLKKDELPVYDVMYKQKKPFEKISSQSSKYIFNCFDVAFNLIKSKKIPGFINCPVSKEYLFKKKYQGVTEFIAKKFNMKNNEVMLIYNKELSVSPVTTHIPLSLVSKKINKNLIIKKIKTINKFYKKTFRKKPVFGVLGLNPHNFTNLNKAEDKKIVKKAVDRLVKFKINAKGPIPADSSFAMFKKYKFDVIIGMYHDQVLTPFKALYKFNAINITLGLPFLRISPDHGTGENLIGKKIANPESLIESIKFFSLIK